MTRAKQVAACAGLALSLALNPASGEKMQDWSFEVAPYLWAMGIDGDLDIGRIDYDASASFSDILDQAEYGAQVLLEANRGRWVNFLQIDYGVLQSDDISGPLDLANVEIEVTSALATLTSGYRAPLGERHSVDFMLGVRFAGFELDVDNSLLGKSTTQEEVFDAILMLRPRIVLSENEESLSLGRITTTKKVDCN